MDFSEAELAELGESLFMNALKLSTTQDDYDSILKRCKARKEKFVDESFPPCRTSLISDWTTSPKAAVWDRFEWRRASEFLTPRDLAVFKQGISPSDIRQGALGNCYFLSALTCLAEVPERIERLFISKQPNPEGLYGIEVCKNGEWLQILLDDYFPCGGPELGPAFSRSNGNELWVLLLEKAWAKIHGSYENIDGGLTKDVLQDLTGAPCEVFSHDDEDLWNKIVSSNEQNFLLTASAGNTRASQALLEQMGLIGQHAYALLEAKAVQTEEAEEKLVKLRNPWGNKEWKGDWSDKSPKWTPALRRELKVTDRDDGSFWMSLEDFTHFFSFVTVCRLSDNYQYFQFKAKHNKGEAALFKLTVSNPSTQYIMINQNDARQHPKNSGYAYSDCRMVVGRADFDYQFGKMSTPVKDRTLWEVQDFEAGEYFIYVEFDWCCHVNDFVIAAYGSDEATIEQIPMNPDFLPNVYKSCALKSGKMTKYENEGAPECVKYSDMCTDGFGYNYFVNNSENVAIKENLTYTKFDNLQLLPPFSGTKYDVTVSPGQDLIILIKQTNPKGYSLSYSYSSCA